MKKKPWIPKTCPTCKKPFKVPEHRVKVGKGKYCSLVCYNKAREGIWTGGFRKDYTFSKETRIKISTANKGKIRTPEARKKYALANSGEKCNFWRGGVSPLRRRLQTCIMGGMWTNKIFQRDNFTCQECKIRGGKLNAHHIKPFSIILREFLQMYPQFSPTNDKELLLQLSYKYLPFWDTSNGQTLCEKCHRKTDTFAKRHDLVKI
jgi:hypothetical protein